VLALKLDLVLFLCLYVCCSAGELPQDVFGKDATAEFDPLVHQVTQYFFAFLANGRYVLRFGVGDWQSRVSFSAKVPA
jgi:hypothetical protein